jgi:orotate phosphoribosyltransferase
MEPIRHPTSKEDIILKVSKGHFATGHSHINYYIDVTAQKFCLSEARKVALELAKEYKMYTLIDTILCLDGTEVIAACMASEMTKSGYMNINQHTDMNVVTPERTVGSQLIFRENTAPLISGKNVLILMASVSTGYTAKSAIETIAYYGGRAVGIASIFATVETIGTLPVTSLFNPKDLPDYTTTDAAACPLCKAGQRLDAIVNSFGYSKL